MTDQDAQPVVPDEDFEAPAAHDSVDNPLEHVGEPVPDPLIDGAEVPPAPTTEG
jgi:hypothetical protein